jgi:RNA polymerase sigma-70 factor (ECF subfamily)
MLQAKEKDQAVVQNRSDSELLLLARKGNAAAFRTLVRRHDRYLYRIARSVSPDNQEAEDVVQETFVRAFKQLASFRGHASLATWLTRITLNEAIHRRRRRRSTIQLESLQEQESTNTQVRLSPLVIPESDPERAAAQHQIRRLLERSIDQLPDSLRTVFVMRDVEALSTAETARLLEIRQATVKTRLHRARRMLREILGEQIGPSLKDVFPFERPRCDRLVERLLNQLGLPPLKTVSAKVIQS